MKLVRFGDKGCEKPGMLDAIGRIRDLSDVIDDISGDNLSDKGLKNIATLDIEMLPIVDPGTRIGPSVGAVGKILCVGLNYADHAAETGASLPNEPVIFSKATSAINGPHDNVEIPRGAIKTDWEVELGVVIGRHTKYISESQSLDHIAGYCVVNDVSERDFQKHRAGQWIKGKSADSFAPIGPWLVTKDEIPDPQNLEMFLEVNGVRYQSGSTATMHFSVAMVVSYLSQFMSLHPGDIIFTGTPPGVGAGQRPQIFLKPGDRMVLGIDGLGEQHQLVIAAA